MRSCCLAFLVLAGVLTLSIEVVISCLESSCPFPFELKADRIFKDRLKQ